jgi:hypothetical protein
MHQPSLRVCVIRNAVCALSGNSDPQCDEFARREIQVADGLAEDRFVKWR